MSQTNSRDPLPVYEIKVAGQLDPAWSDWLSGLTVMVEHGGVNAITTFAGQVRDQAALRGILTKLWDLNLTLLSVTQINQE
jgi:hypothetical protein